LSTELSWRKWCSRSCQERTAFARAQLGLEPAWLRVIRDVDIRLLDEVGLDNLSDSFQALSVGKATDADMVKKMQALALERGELNVTADDGSVDLVERAGDNVSKAPSLKKKSRSRVD